MALQGSRPFRLRQQGVMAPVYLFLIQQSSKTKYYMIATIFSLRMAWTPTRQKNCPDCDGSDGTVADLSVFDH